MPFPRLERSNKHHDRIIRGHITGLRSAGRILTYSALVEHTGRFDILCSNTFIWHIRTYHIRFIEINHFAQIYKHTG